MIILQGSPRKKEVALIFDDGPNPFVTPKLLKVLEDKGVSANFFLIGMRAEQSPDIVKQIVELGHEIGNHTYTHKNLVNVLEEQGEQAMRDEIVKSHNAIAKAAGIDRSHITYLRPPYIGWSDEVAKIIEPIYGDNIILSGLVIGDYDWGIDHKWDEHDKSAISVHAKRITAAWTSVVENGTLLGFHDSAEYNLPGNKQYDNWMMRALPTLEAIPAIIDYLQDKGFKMARLSEMELVTQRSM